MHIIIDGIKSFLHIYTNKCLWSSSIDYIDGKLDFSLLINISAGFEP